MVKKVIYFFFFGVLLQTGFVEAGNYSKCSNACSKAKCAASASIATQCAGWCEGIPALEAIFNACKGLRPVGEHANLDAIHVAAGGGPAPGPVGGGAPGGPAAGPVGGGAPGGPAAGPVGGGAPGGPAAGPVGGGAPGGPAPAVGAGGPAAGGGIPIPPPPPPPVLAALPNTKALYTDANVRAFCQAYAGNKAQLIADHGASVEEKIATTGNAGVPNAGDVQIRRTKRAAEQRFYISENGVAAAILVYGQKSHTLANPSVLTVYPTKAVFPNNAGIIYFKNDPAVPRDLRLRGLCSF